MGNLGVTYSNAYYRASIEDKGKAPKGKSSKVTSGWLKRFLERSPERTLRRGDDTANVRMDCCNDDMIK